MNRGSGLRQPGAKRRRRRAAAGRAGRWQLHGHHGHGPNQRPVARISAATKNNCSTQSPKVWVCQRFVTFLLLFLLCLLVECLFCLALLVSQLFDGFYCFGFGCGVCLTASANSLVFSERFGQVRRASETLAGAQKGMRECPL